MVHDSPREISPSMLVDLADSVPASPKPCRSEAESKEFARTLPPGADLWVFGYGSLMWNPGFPYQESRPGLLRGYHRRFCISSHRYRGTRERPGLVLGLDRGGSCRGIAFRVAAPEVPGVLHYLWHREMISGAYRPKLLPVRVAQETVRACTFVAQRRHWQYCGLIDSDTAVTRIRQCQGERGPNIDYLVNTVRHLRELGIHDAPLERLLKLAGVED